MSRHGSTSSMGSITLSRQESRTSIDVGSLIQELEGMMDLTKPDDFSDVTLVVEDKKLYYCRGILASASPVWKKMFVSDFREKDAKEIPLPGKEFNDVRELLYCIYPAIQKPISEDNVLRILPLADEYQMSKLKTDCEQYLLYELSQIDCPDSNMKYLMLSQKYSLDTLNDRTVEIASGIPSDELEAHEEFCNIEKDTYLKITAMRTRLLEKNYAKLDQSTKSLEKKCGEMEEVMKKMSREKLTMKRVLDEMDGAWEIKGSDARCIDPVHIYGPRNYNCEKCTRQVETYIQSKVWHLLNRGATCSGISWPQ